MTKQPQEPIVPPESLCLPNGGHARINRDRRLPGLVCPGDGHPLECWEGGCDQCVSHNAACPCAPCIDKNGPFEAVEVTCAAHGQLERPESLDPEIPAEIRVQADADLAQIRRVAGTEAALNGQPIGRIVEGFTIREGKTDHGLKRAFDLLGVGIRYNVRAHRDEYTLEVNPYWIESDWQPFSDRIEAKFRELLAERFTYKDSRDNEQSYRLSAAVFRDLLNAILATVEVDPFKQWLERLPR